MLNRCSNADPNYGTMWFHCRHRSFDSSNAVLEHALHILTHELTSCHRIYVRAIVHYIHRKVKNKIIETYKSQHVGDTDNIWRQNISFLKDFDESRRKLGSDWSDHHTRASVIDIDGRIFISSDFISSIIELNRMLYNKHISDEDRRKLLFTFDQILS